MDRLANINKVVEHLMADEGVQYRMPPSLAERQRLLRALMNTWQPHPVSQELIEAQDRELQQQREEKGVVVLEDEGLLLWQGDITRLKVDAIVNAANTQMLGCWMPLHACIDNCIHSAAGIQLRAECDQLMKAQGHDEPTGKAKITKGYNLPAKYVIHTVGPIIEGGIPTPEQEEQLASCYRSCLAIAEEHQLRSIAFCCISTGVFHFPNQRAAEIATETVRNYPLHSLKTIIFNVFLEKDYAIYQKLL